MAAFEYTALDDRGKQRKGVFGDLIVNQLAHGVVDHDDFIDTGAPPVSRLPAGLATLRIEYGRRGLA